MVWIIREIGIDSTGSLHVKSQLTTSDPSTYREKSSRGTIMQPLPPALLFLLLSCAGGVLAAGPADVPVLRVSVPHDAYPGYCITRLHYWGQAFSLLDNESSGLFAVLGDGLLMPTADLTHLADSPPLTLVVKEESQNGTREQMVVVHVVDRNRLVRFTQETYTGSVYENEPVGTVVEGLDRLFATSDPHHPMVYTFVSGNEEDAFSIVQPASNLSTALLIRTNRVLDREQQEIYDLVIRATDVEEANSADASVTIVVDNLNDNAPVPERTVYEFRIPEDLEMYSIVGNVSAYDADGDRPVYHLVSRHPVFAIIPKTGQILLIATPELKTYKLSIRTQDTAKPPRVSAPFSVYIEVFSEELLPEAEMDPSLETNEVLPVRQKRSVRPTKSYEYKETDGSKPGKVMFQLDKKHPQETYKMEGPVKWVEVDSSGDVKVKEPWDYEQLGKEKTIDFWVFVTGPNINGKSIFCFLKKKKGFDPLYRFCQKKTYVFRNFL
ncbi:neural-cadherin [Trichonephila inaurata madagascariensis]|uniref:Neural-cadherin n=1 Tax=Trichonephila inaurata madagascariensis TaxID=2747483 RepID=A0A8X6XGK5_9ARAC|nr:neural-cadherin [Trichonephila inaurata madagascariensis]